MSLELVENVVYLATKLSSLARKFLCICATSVASDHTFSIGGNIVTSKRNCLKPHTVDQLVFLAQNLD